jgi:hypothetical protein
VEEILLLRFERSASKMRNSVISLLAGERLWNISKEKNFQV